MITTLRSGDKPCLTDSTMELRKAKYPKLDVSYDMGWQQRSSGHRYASPSGDALLVGCRTRKPIALTVRSKLCNLCKAWEKKKKKKKKKKKILLADNNNNGEDIGLLEVPPHNCTKNHVGSSSSMEPLGCLDMVVDLFDNKHCIIKRVCCDDDASTRSLMRWFNADYMKNNNTTVRPTIAKTRGDNAGEMKPRPDVGKLPGHIPEPAFVADPNHRKKVLTGDLYKLNKKPVSQKFGMTTMDITRLGTGFGYMIRSLHKRPKSEWENAGKAVVEHHFNNHEFCVAIGVLGRGYWNSNVNRVLGTTGTKQRM
jgi:hypothetical protein